MQWKISFHPGSSKQAQKAIFIPKIQKDNHSPLGFNNNDVEQSAARNIEDSF